MQVVSIDLGQYFVKIAELEVSSKERKVVGLHQVRVHSPKEIAPALKDFFSRLGYKPDRVSVGLGHQSVFYKKMSFPFGDNRVQAAVEGEFIDSLPIELEDPVVDFKLLKKEKKKYHFLAGLCPREHIEKLNEIFDDAKITTHTYYYDPEALARLALNQSLPAAKKGEYYAVIDIGYKITKIAILFGSTSRGFDRKAPKEYDDGEIVEVRTIQRGAFEIDAWMKDQHKELSEKDLFRLIYDEGEIIEGDPGDGEDFLDGTPEKFSDDLKVALRPLVVEVYQTLQSVRSRLNVNTTTLYGTGKLFNIKGFQKFLQKEIRIKVHHWPVFEGFTSDNTKLSPKLERSFATAIALAHSWSLKKSNLWLNFKKGTQASRKPISYLISKCTEPATQKFLFPSLAFVGFLYIYMFLGSFLNTKVINNLRVDLDGELRAFDVNLMTKVKRSGYNFHSTKKVVASSKRKLLAKQRNQSSRLPYHPRINILELLSKITPENTTLIELKVENLNLRSTFKIKNPAKENVEKLSQQIKQSLMDKNYQNVSSSIKGDQVIITAMAKETD